MNQEMQNEIARKARERWAKQRAEKEAAEPVLPEIEWLQHEEVLPSSLNPRKHYDPAKLEELQQSFRAHGFTAAMSHLLVRPHPTEAGKYELICGERRWRAAGAEGIASVPAVVQEMSDVQVLELQLVENLQRDDLTPIEEAEGYRLTLELRDGEGKPVHTLKTLAGRLGKTEMHLRDRLSLCRLRGTRTGDALEAGDLTITHARLLARLPGDGTRDELTKRVLSQNLPYRVLENIIRNEVMVELRGASFDQGDANLVPVRTGNGGERVAGGACADCPFNTKNSAEGDGGKIHMCMHPECFREKTAAAHRAWQESVKADGVEALPVEATEQIFDYTGKRLASSSEYVEIGDKPMEHLLNDDAEAPGNWKKLIKGQGVPIVLAKDKEGAVHELVRRDLAMAAAEQNGHAIFRGKQKPTPRPTTAEHQADLERLKAERELERRTREAVDRDLLQAACAMKKQGEDYWRALVRGIFLSIEDTDGLDQTARMVGAPWDELANFGENEEALQKHLEQLPVEHLPGAALLMSGSILWPDADEAQAWRKQLCKLLGVDAKMVEKRVKLEVAEEEKRAREAKEIAEGLQWQTRREKAEDFIWDGNQCDAADVCDVKMPADVRQTVRIHVARSATGWHSGWKIVNGKTTKEQPVKNDPPHYGTRELAVKKALLELGEHYAAANLPGACRRLDEYIELISTPAKGKKKWGGK